ncbi:MAG TPA: hypothetical protein VLB46_06325 [Pyrinomonadaceae bacterium]|nr:hypothetical protein [Pyrinomonadaceae bacterium]
MTRVSACVIRASVDVRRDLGSLFVGAVTVVVRGRVANSGARGSNAVDPGSISAQLKIKPYTFENDKKEKVDAEFGLVPENRSN